MRRRPKRSPRAPPTSSRAERKRVYASTTHWTWATVAPRFSWRAGRATLTAVPSMNAMLEPRMVAASTQGAAPRPERITPSLHGSLRTCTRRLYALRSGFHRLGDQLGHPELPVPGELRRRLPGRLLVEEREAVSQHQADEGLADDPAAQRSELDGVLVVPFERLLRLGQDVVPERRLAGELGRDLGQRFVLVILAFGRFAHHQLVVGNHRNAHLPRHVLPRRQPHAEAPEEVAFGERRNGRSDRWRQPAERIDQRRIDLVRLLQPVLPPLRRI